MRKNKIRTAIVQTRLTVQEKADFLAAIIASIKGTNTWYAPSPSELLRGFAIEFTTKYLPKGEQ